MMRPAVGLMPATELALDGHKMEPSVSVPRDTATKFAATDIADPLLDPQESADRTQGFCKKIQNTRKKVYQICIIFLSKSSNLKN
ncbi:hypothetical protein D5086_009099 [Populus alba]|uniref:Uncharacterized protein n=1 Tax=Populus alba TaxID=43335 RepID=A0ACC4CJ18_POPAL